MIFAACTVKAPHIIVAFITRAVDEKDEYGPTPLPRGFRCEPVDEKLVDAEQITLGMEFDPETKSVRAYLPPAPDVVTAAQAKVALWQAGLLDTVTAAASKAEYMPMKIYFENATEWHRGNPYVQGLAAELGLKDDTLDNLFRQAAEL